MPKYTAEQLQQMGLPPAVAATYAGTNIDPIMPAQTEISEYDETVGRFAFVTDVGFEGTAGGPEAAFASLSGQQRGYVPGLDATGTHAIKFDNGVVAVPDEDRVVYPTYKAAPGSEPWLSEIQDEWDKDRIKEWRTRLAAEGYNVDTSGGMAHDLLDALRLYHKLRYLNRGKPLPLHGGAPSTARAAVKGAIDPFVLNQRVENMIQGATGEAASEGEIEHYSQEVMALARELAQNKGFTTEQAITGAEARVAKRFSERPDIAFQLERREDIEENNRLRDFFLSTAQIASL